MIVADTSVWIPFLKDPESAEKRAIDALIDQRRIALVGVVLAELLQGCRSPKEADALLSNLAGLRFLADSFTTWKRAGELAASLRRKGTTLPLSDLVIAALALEHGCHVYTLDPHFQRIPGLSPYRAPRPAGRRPSPTT